MCPVEFCYFWLCYSSVCLLQEIKALEKVIGDLLEGCHVHQARWLASLFNHSCLELDIVMVRNCIIYNQERQKSGRFSLEC